MKQLLFSVTKKDLIIQTFRAGGKGGQNQNKVESGVRIIHPASGARGEARDTRDQHNNKKAAFRRMVESKEFLVWYKIETARRMGEPIPETKEEIEARVDRMIQDGLKDGTIKVEGINAEIQ